MLLFLLAVIGGFVLLSTALSRVESAAVEHNSLSCFVCHGARDSPCDLMSDAADTDADADADARVATATCPITTFCGVKCRRRRRVIRGCMTEQQQANCTGDTNCNICNTNFCNNAPSPCNRLLDNFFDLFTTPEPESGEDVTSYVGDDEMMETINTTTRMEPFSVE